MKRGDEVMNVLSTNGAGSNSPGWSEANPWVHVCIGKPPELPVYFIAV